MKAILSLCFGLLMFPVLSDAANDETKWNSELKKEFFGNKSIVESDEVIEIDAPYRAEDPALVPIKIVSKMPQTEQKFIKKIVMVVDKNPYPFVGEFEFTPASGKADLAMRIRVNTYSYVRAIAELNDGQLFMTKKFVKASGGCSAPLGADLDAAMKRLGKMKFKLDDQMQSGKPTMAQLLISHPNITGMQMDQVTRFIKKSHFMDHLTVSYEGQPVLKAKTDIAISADPNFRFYFVPQGKGELKAEFTDVSCETPTSRKICTSLNSYTATETVTP